MRLGDGISWEASQDVGTTTTRRNRIRVPRWAGYLGPQVFDSIQCEVDLAFAIGVVRESTDD